MNPLKNMWKFLVGGTEQALPGAKFVDLAPTSDADETGIYHDALRFATNSSEVLNIALTGPYGSGKSSVIKSFLLKYPRPSLELSLAAFLPEGEVKGIRVTKQEIERSILQQILYGAGADKLPLSRFKRIEIPRAIVAAFWSLTVFLGVSCLWYVFSNQADILSGNYFKSTVGYNWFNIIALITCCAFVWGAICRLYLKSFNLSLKSISLKDIQIAPNATSEESILNKHLDEIIYFFQATEYDLVVIEDLDRFDNPDIFVTLREINALINENAGIRRKIRFLYALRDDIFINTDRTKFFEFIVPIIPVINHSNSIDKVLQHAKRIELDLDRPQMKRFIRDVSHFLDDLRLIANIFNEYVIYSANLRLDAEKALDPVKLLAVLIYKNVIPTDFAALHRQEGALSKVLSRYDYFVETAGDKIREELKTLELNMNEVDAQLLRDFGELRSVYVVAIMAKAPPQYTFLDTAFGTIAFNELARHQEFEQILAEQSIRARNTYTGQTFNIDLRGVEADVDSRLSYAERKALIEQGSTADREIKNRKSQALKQELTALRARKFHELARDSAKSIEEDFAEVGGQKDLLRFLILEGHLDNTYYQYTSLFHSERMSRNDNKFLIKIRSFNNPDPDFQLDSVAEVIESMHEEDFGRSYVLNRFLVDYLLDNEGNFSSQLASASGFMATNVDECEMFFQSYYAQGKHVDKLIATLFKLTPRFVIAALKSPLAVQHAARIIAHAPVGIDPQKPVGFALARFMSKAMDGVLNERVAFDHSILKSLRVQIEDVSSLGGHSDILAYVASEGLYRLSIANIRHVMEHVVQYPKLSDFETKHYSALCDSGYRPLIELVESNFEKYLQDVLLKLNSNTEEDLQAIKAVLLNDDIGLESRSEFLSMQTAIFPSFAGVPPEFHQLLLQEHKIENTWENCLAFISASVFAPKILTEYLQDGKVCRSLSRRMLPNERPASVLRSFVIENDALSDDVYRSYARKLPSPVAKFPDVGQTKIRILIEEKKVVFSKEAFEQLEADNLKALFIELNFESYRNVREKLPIADEIRIRLLRSDLVLSCKLAIVADVAPNTVPGNPSMAAALGPVLNYSTETVADFDYAFINAVIVNSHPASLQVSLLNKLHRSMTPQEVRSIIQQLPKPYSDIASFGKSPKLERHPLNEELVSWLIERRLISSSTPTLLGDEIRLNTFRKTP